MRFGYYLCDLKKKKKKRKERKILGLLNQANKEINFYMKTG